MDFGRSGERKRAAARRSCGVPWRPGIVTADRSASPSAPEGRASSCAVAALPVPDRLSRRADPGWAGDGRWRQATFPILFGSGIARLPTTTPESFATPVGYVLLAVGYTPCTTALLWPCGRCVRRTSTAVFRARCDAVTGFAGSLLPYVGRALRLINKVGDTAVPRLPPTPAVAAPRRQCLKRGSCRTAGVGRIGCSRERSII